MGRGPYVVDGGTSDAEAWILAVLARRAQAAVRVRHVHGQDRLPLGTERPAGRTRRHAHARAGERRATTSAEASDDPTDVRVRADGIDPHGVPLLRHAGGSARSSSCSATARRSTSRRGQASCDLVFVDGSHAYSYVVSDSEKALELVAPGRPRALARLRRSATRAWRLPRAQRAARAPAARAHRGNDARRVPQAGVGLTTERGVADPAAGERRASAIVMMSAVGDAVHVLPVLNAIKRALARRDVTWVLQPGPASLVRGHRAVDEIVEFDRARGWRAYPAVRRALARRAVRRRARAAGLLQGRHRHVVHARAGEARLRPRARARPELAVHDAPASRRTRASTCRISTSSSSTRSASRTESR